MSILGSATPGVDVVSRVEVGTPVRVLISVAGCMHVQPDDRSVDVATRNQYVGDAVRLLAGEMRSHPLRRSGAAEDAGEAVQRLLEITTFVAPGEKHSNQCWLRAHLGGIPTNAVRHTLIRNFTRARQR